MAYVFRGTDHTEPAYLNEPLPESKCGTRAGYQKHHRNKEAACDECAQAHAEYMRDYMTNYIPNMVHGTMTGYRAHNKAGETPCDECKAVNAQYKADYKKRRARGQIRHGWTDEKCGTVAGYSMHYRYGVKVCPRCRAAQTIYQRSLKMQKDPKNNDGAT
jgi:hypothetical protein